MPEDVDLSAHTLYFGENSLKYALLKTFDYLWITCEIHNFLSLISGRVTGLDPAEPYFGYEPNEVCLDSTDAKFVDIIHTDAVHFTHSRASEGLGIMNAVGHIGQR